MFIKDIFSTKKVTVSFEIFPPKNDKPIGDLYKTVEELKELKPDFISVTYGAGGSSKDRTIEIASFIKNNYNIETVAHLTCATSTEEELDSILDELEKNNIHNVLALRGDIPQGFKLKQGLKYKYAKDLIRKIREKRSFCISAAAYPEGHTESESIEKDIEYLKEKVECGVDFLITQLFFDNNILFNFRERLCKSGINIPIVAGIMPVTNYKQIERIIALSGASIPDKLKLILDKYRGDQEKLKKAGIEYASNQITNLISNGVNGIHIYTMNKAEVARKIVETVSAIELK